MEIPVKIFFLRWSYSVGRKHETVNLLDDSEITVGRDLLCLFLDGAMMRGWSEWI